MFLCETYGCQTPDCLSILPLKLARIIGLAFFINILSCVYFYDLSSSKPTGGTGDLTGESSPSGIKRGSSNAVRRYKFKEHKGKKR